MGPVDLDHGARTVRRVALAAFAFAFALTAAAAAVDAGAVWNARDGTPPSSGPREILGVATLAFGVLGASGLLVTSLVLITRREGQGGLIALGLLAAGGYAATHAVTRGLPDAGAVLTADAVAPLVWHLATAALVVALAVCAGSRGATLTGILAYGVVAVMTILGYVWVLGMHGAALNGHWSPTAHVAWLSLPFVGTTVAYALHAFALALLVAEEVRARERVTTATLRPRHAG